MRLLKTMALLFVLSTLALGQARSTADAMRGNFSAVNKHLLDMAKDFPADKYDFKLKPEMRSFGEVLVHVASGNVYAAKIGNGQKANWDELDAKQYKGKAAIVTMFEKSMNDADAALKKMSDADLSKSISPWIGVMEHSAEHYGLLVAYYRANNMVPPESRPRK
jgi:hypothetical protein